jgi:2-polyprenyl-3-methyl-5-hydroxy-6-metoxy-1,4-benzoquinol methylase
MSLNKLDELKDLEFYTVQEVPGVIKETEGEWDLRDNVDEYLGNTFFKDKSVLELGPASGFLTFYMESKGADVTCVELSTKNDKWDVVPNCKKDWKKMELDHRMNDLTKLQKAFWFSHKANNSKAKVINTHIYNLGSQVEQFDIALLGSILLHLQNPFEAIKNMLTHTKSTAIITDLLPNPSLPLLTRVINKLIPSTKLKNFSEPAFYFLPSIKNNHDFAWWKFNPSAIIKMVGLLGFEDCKVTYHNALQFNKPRALFTVTCQRTVPIEKCNY